MGTEESDDFVVQLLRENRRLKTELQRREAIASSRWWRLHPRLNLQRLRAALRVPPDARPAGGPSARAPVPAVPQPAPSDIVGRFRHDVVERGTFSHDWFTPHIPSWEPMMEALEGRTARVLEIGAFEGLSACFVLWRLPEATVTAIDTFAGSAEQVARDLLPDTPLEGVFDANIASFDASRARKLVGDSKRVLLDLHREHARFDFVYVDGSHLALDVLIDAALSWSLLTVGGFLVFDDYGWSAVGPDPLLRPGPAIDAFLDLVEGKYELLSKGTQLSLRKTSA